MSLPIVMPAEAGIHIEAVKLVRLWTLAYAGVTGVWGKSEAMGLAGPLIVTPAWG